MDKKAILAVVLSLGIWMGWQKFYLEPIQHQAQIEKQQQALLAKREEVKADIDAKGIFPASKRIENRGKEAVVASTALLENADSKLVVSSGPGFLQSWELKSFTNTIDKKEDTVQMKGVAGFDSQLSVRFSDNALSDLVSGNWDTLKTEGSTATAQIQRGPIAATKKVSLDAKGYGATVDFGFRFSGEPPKYIFLDLFGNPHRENDKEGSIFGQAPDKVHFTYRDQAGHHTNMASALKEDVESAAGVKWLGLDTRYFVLALTPTQEMRASTGIQVKKEMLNGSQAIRGSLVIPTEGKKEINVAVKVFFGPKHWESLQAVDPIFTDAIDFGWTSFLAVPLLQALKWFYSYVHNYGIAIIILTFLIKVLLFPLTYKSMTSMAKMSRLQPQLNALREKYKDDKEKLNVEMMGFMKSNGYNPVSGCLPILLQMPVFFSLYRVLFNSMELYQAPFGLWIHDLSSPDPFFVTPVLLAGLMYLQQKLSPSTATDPAQQKMLQIMPVMFGVFMLLLPAGLNIYMVVNSATSILQQWILNKKLGIVPAGTKA